ncbi:IclR family transcriptional regulator [Haloarchaeobius sp. HME9146]|uniref:IclR family transcriptional regulator n=1 Tax=Haloarchaeobius sp. HME9146 TaxID=2978732 RepID=UPI0021BFD052|nr:IclR family transcriptional regulator [Haloarchaeobius sp. HME9146]MCT9095601.1 IclR family transcriptional regulator [Haloarchaeobius sp. HME9146]
MGEYPVGATATTFRVVDELTKVERAGVTELADRLDLSKGGVHNHLRTLEQLGYVVREDGEYRLGFRFLDLGSQIRARERLYQVARPHVERLAESSGETASLVVEEQGEAVYVFSAGSDVDDPIRDGGRAPLHACAGGKALLANKPERERDELLGDELAPRTERTTTDRDELASQLRTARDQRLAFDRGELRPDRRAVAAPILTDADVVVGAVSVSGPTERMSGKRLDEDMPGLVISCANSVTVEFVSS